MRNSAELRRFSSRHPLFFSEFLVQFFGSNEKGMEARTYIGWATPCRPLRGDRPLSPRWGGPTGPPPSTHPRSGTSLQIQKKITLRSYRPLLGRQGSCRPWSGRPGAIFEIFQNGHIFLKFLFFFKRETEGLSLAPFVATPLKPSPMHAQIRCAHTAQAH